MNDMDHHEDVAERVELVDGDPDLGYWTYRVEFGTAYLVRPDSGSDRYCVQFFDIPPERFLEAMEDGSTSFHNITFAVPLPGGRLEMTRRGCCRVFSGADEIFRTALAARIAKNNCLAHTFGSDAIAASLPEFS